MPVNLSGSKTNTRFANKLYVNKQQRDGLDMNDLLRLPVNIYWKNKYGFYLGCNDTMAEIASLNKRCDIIGSKAQDYITKASASLVEAVDQLVINNNSIAYKIETADFIYSSKLLADALLLTYISIKQPLYSADGNMIGMFGFSIPFNLLACMGWELFEHILVKNHLQHINKIVNDYLLKQINEISRLTNREKQCLFYLSRGRTFKQIASVLNLSAKTVEYYWENIKMKVNCNLKSEIIDKYMLYKLLEN